MNVTLKVQFPNEVVKFKYSNFDNEGDVENFIFFLKDLWTRSEHDWEKLFIYKGRKLVDTVIG
jgi:hypothetical protein